MSARLGNLSSVWFSSTAALLLLATQPIAAEDVLLTEKPSISTAVTVQLEVRGKLLVERTETESEGEKSDGEQKKNAAENNTARIRALPMTVKGLLQFHQRAIPSATGTQSAVRHYMKSEGTVTIDGRQFKPTLPEDRRLVRVDIEGESIRYRSLEGTLTREQRDVVAVQGNPLLLHRLLPDQMTTVEQTWAIDGNGAAPIFGLEVAYSSSLEGQLRSVKDNVALIRIHGEINGSTEGVPSQIDCEANLEFDCKSQQIVMFDATFREKRDISGGQPGIETDCRLRTQIKRSTIPGVLKDGSIASLLKDDSTAEMLRYSAPNKAFQILHSPQWRVIGDSPKRTVFRLLDAGDVVAQGNVSLLQPLPAGEQLTLKAFEEDVRATLEKLKGAIEQSEQTKLDSGMRLLRVVGQGKIQEVDVQWVYLHLSNDAGKRASCVFTLDQKQAAKFDGQDVSLLTGFEFLAKPQAAAKPGVTR